MRNTGLAEYTTRLRWTEVDARSALQDLAASGLCVAEFARREGLDAQRVARWRKRLETGTDGPSSAPEFVEVPTRAGVVVEIVLRSGRLLRVPEAIDASALERIVGVLDREMSC